jgi:hypothetical protein
VDIGFRLYYKVNVTNKEKMMDNHALISKALGSDSEEEAIACLRMARKKGLNIDTIVSPVNKNSATEAQTKQMLYMINTLRNERDDYQRLYLDYKRRWGEEGYKVKKLQDQLKNVPAKIVGTIAIVSSVVTLLWLLVGLAVN